MIWDQPQGVSPRFPVLIFRPLSEYTSLLLYRNAGPKCPDRVFLGAYFGNHGVKSGEFLEFPGNGCYDKPGVIQVLGRGPVSVGHLMQLFESLR